MATKASPPRPRAEPPAGRAAGAAGPAGALEVGSGLAAMRGPRRGHVLVATVHLRVPGTGEPMLLYRTTAPVYPIDTRRELLDRSEELRLRALRAAVIRTGDAHPRGEGRAPAVDRGSVVPLRRLADVPRGLALRHGARRLLARLRPRTLAKGLLLRAAMVAYRPARDLWRTARRRHPVRVFTFHRVTDLCRDSLTASRRDFAAQARHIRRTHEVVTLEEALRLVGSGAALRRPVAALTFDDAYRSVRDHAAPVLAELGVRGCCFAPTAWIGSDGRFPWDADNPSREHLDVMSWKELQELRDQGWTVGGHTSTHARLSRCDDAELERELRDPLEQLRLRLGVEAPAMAYPFGGPQDVDLRALDRVERLGYTACLSNHGGENRPWTSPSPFRLSRIDIGGDLDPLVWKARVHGIDSSRWLRRIPEPERAGSLDEPRP